jgi:lipopolysaccharide transport system ATP-binding protein
MFSDDVAISVKNLSKRFELYGNPRDRLKQFVLPRLQRLAGQQPKQYFGEFWALKDVSFEIKKGETVGIIGRNGSGKSTLLQIICGTLSPTSGEVETRGRIAALLELGSGFNPEFTGRENVRMSCALLGLTPEETNARFDEIAAFADIGDFIEQPVKTYSSGMFVRLAFSVNLVTRPQILIVDEALSVGDIAFQAKCITALNRLRSGGATILFVSHDMGTIKSLCSHAIYLEKGNLVNFGPAPEIAEQYIALMREEINSLIVKPTKRLGNDNQDFDHKLMEELEMFFSEQNEFQKRASMFRYGSGEARLTYVEVINANGQCTNTVDFDELITIKCYILFRTDISLAVAYYVQDNKKIKLIGGWNYDLGIDLIEGKAGEKIIVTFTTTVPLQEGDYSIEVELSYPVIVDQVSTFIDVVNDAVVIRVGPRHPIKVWSKVFLPAQVRVDRIG